MLDVAKCTLFVRLAEIGGLTKAASLLGTTASQLSRQLAGLEASCGGPLFHRTGRGLVLSDLGARLLPHAERVMLEVRDLEIEIHNATGAPQGVVHLGMLPAAADPLLTIMLQRLLAEAPGIHLRVIEGNSGQLEQKLALGQLDVAFLVREISAARVGGDRLLSLNPLHLLVPADDPLAGHPTIRFAQLDGVPLLLPGMPNSMRNSLQAVARQQGIDLNIILEIDSLPIQVQLLRAGLGYCIGSRGTVKTGTGTGIAALRIIDPVLERGMILATTTQRPLGLAARTVLAMGTHIAGELCGTGIWQGLDAGSPRDPAA